MKIGIFTKFGMIGGSELRAIEFANALSQHTKHDSYILSEKEFVPKLRPYLDDNIPVYSNIFKDEQNSKILYDMNSILIVNSDSKKFTDLDFWTGKSKEHKLKINLNKIKQMVFLFNFIISPSIKLGIFSKVVKDIRIAATNTKFFNEISYQDRYEPVKHLPRTILFSPIQPKNLTIDKNPSDKIRLGMHSRGLGNKWNKDYHKLIRKINEDRGEDSLIWDFMGCSSDFRKSVENIPNVITRKEFSVPVKKYLKNIDIFIFFPSWSREEAWGRVVAEAMISGCPVVTSNKGGNPDQVIHGNTGFLCKNTEEFVKYTNNLCKNKELYNSLQNNSMRFARNFYPETIIKQFENFIRY